MAWRNTVNILLTGSSGLIGRAIREELSRHGIKVLVPKKLGTITSFTKNGGIDLSKENLDLTALVDAHPDAIVHAAAIVPAEPGEDTESRAALNRQIDRNVYCAQRRWDIPCIYLSGCSLYNQQLGTTCDENSRLKKSYQLTPYLDSKIDGEKLFTAENDGVILRLSSPLGPGLRSTSVVSQFLNAANAGGVLNVWGSGLREQDFIDVRDVARLVSSCIAEPKFGIFNIASGKAVTMRNLAQLIVAMFGRGRIVCGRREDPQDKQLARYDIRKAKETFNWRPVYTLEDSLVALRDQVASRSPVLR